MSWCPFAAGRSLSTIIKDGAIFDAAELLGDVEEMVAARRGAA